MSNLTKHGVSELAQIPDYLKHDGPSRGAEDITRDDMVTPRLAIAQANSPQRKKQDPSFIEGLEESSIFNTVTGQIYGTKLTLVPLFFFKQRMMFDDNNSILCQSFNGIDGGRLHPSDCATCPHAQFKNDEEDARPDCNTLFNYMALLPGGELAALSLKSTGLKAAKQLNAKVRMSKLDMFARVLHVESISMTKKNNQFWGYKLELGEFVPKELYDAASSLFADLRGKNVNLDTKGLDDEGGTTPEDSGAVPF